METAVDILSWVALMTGSFFAVVAGIGLLRLPDYYTRIHGAGVTDTLAAGLILFGLALQQAGPLVTLKLLLVFLFLALTGPASGHALAKAAYQRGLVPWRVESAESKEGSGDLVD